MVILLVNDALKIIWKEVVVAYSRYYLDIYLLGEGDDTAIMSRTVFIGVLVMRDMCVADYTEKVLCIYICRKTESDH
jgi:hypothetical protein